LGTTPPRSKPAMMPAANTSIFNSPFT
jgi:hypothetical protein